MLLFNFQLIFKNPWLNSISTSLSVKLRIDDDTAVAHAAVPQDFVNPAPRSQTFILIWFLFIIFAIVTFHFFGK